jgi:ubiquinone/menaquinone biosynthesis C-methylase UbiE
VNRKVAVGAGAVLVASIASQRVKPIPCPYSMRWTTEIPRPYLSRAAVVKVLAPQPGEQILEVGPANGYHSFAVAERLAPGGTLHALDIQQKMLDALMRRAAQRGIATIAPRQGDARALPYSKDSFDAAFLVTVLGEVPDQAAALSELHRVIRPGGRLVVGETAPLDPHFVRFAALCRRAEAAGFAFESRRGPRLSYLATFVRS